jgi:4-amino-4-deoxy-L-arabinose transferase-like glycosyltransferase
MINNNILYEQLKNIRVEVWLLLILIFALLIRLHFFIGIGITDDLKYVWSAYLLSSGQWDKYPINVIDPLRSMMVLPLALVFSIFGVSMHSAAIPPLFFSLGNIVLTYLIGKLIFNKNVGLLAAFFLSIIPLDVVYST